MESGDELHPAVRALKTICRCNNIKYRTIERAIRGGASTISQVAARTTATTGHCGGSCTPDVQDMIGDLAPPAVEGTASDAGEWWVRKK
jgi:NAD(P)H-nitrite reductase large subunit